MAEKEEEEKTPSFDEQIGSMVSKAIAPVREKYEKTIEELEERSRKTISELEDKLRAILAQMSTYTCYNCNKDLISGKDSIYTSFTGHKYCSHKCIDEKAVENGTK